MPTSAGKIYLGSTLVAGGEGGGGEGWVRPADWLPMPTVLETEEKFVGLFAVYDLPENFIAVYLEGDYTVDWGDGNVENISSGVKAQHSYAWSEIDSETLTSDGYRQVLVTVTPQSGQNLTFLDLSVRHDNISAEYSDTPWLDLAISMPEAGTGPSINLFFDGYGATGTGFLLSAQRVDIIHAGNMSQFTYMMAGNPSLQYARIRNSPSAEDFTSLCEYCDNLREVILEDISSVQLLVSTFSQCRSLKSVQLSDASSAVSTMSMFLNCTALTSVPLFNTSSVTSMQSMFSGCEVLESVPLFDTSSVTTASAMFDSCSQLTSVPLFNLSSLTEMNGMFGYCYNLRAVPLLDISLVTSAYLPFIGCTNLQAGVLSGTATDISYADCSLSRQAIIDIFNELATVIGKTISVYNCYGSFELTEEDAAIATDKGWSVIY